MKTLKIKSLLFVFTFFLSIFPAAVNAIEDVAWQWQNPLPKGASLQDIWGSSEKNIFAVGSGGAIFNYDGNLWKEMASGTEMDLNSVWGASEDNVFVAGDEGIILHYDGENWTKMDSGTSNDLLGIWGSSETDLFAVGKEGTILHYNGIDWSAMSSNTSEGLTAIWGNSGNDIFAVGYNGIILHYDGNDWTEMVSNTSKGLYGVWSSSKDNAFIAGSDGSGSVILHYDGANWTSMPDIERCSYMDIWGTSDKNVFAVGSNGKIFHYNGESWTKMASGASDSIFLRGVGGSSETDIFVVGDSSLILHYDGTGWNNMTTITTGSLRDIWGSSSKDIFAVGDDVILHYNGISWTAENTHHTLMGVWGSSETDVFAVGLTGTIIHYDGKEWKGSPISNPVGNNLWDIWGSSEDDVFAVGTKGIILHYDGSTWKIMESGTLNDLNSVWGTSEKDVFAAGDDGIFLHYDGNNWSSWSAPVNDDFKKIWGFSNNNFYAVAHDVYHYDGSAWTKLLDTLSWINDIWGSSNNDIFTLINDEIHHYDGSSWKKMDGNTKNTTLKGVWGSSKDDVYAVGSGGAILHYSVVSITRTPNQEVYNGNYTITVTVLAGGGTIEYNINSDSWNTYTKPVVISTEGSYNFEARVAYPSQNVFNATPVSFIIDRTAPTAPALDSSDPPVNTWSTDNTITVTLNPGVDQGSGVAGYSYIWDTNAVTEPDDTIDTTEITITSEPLPYEKHYLHVCAIDKAGLKSPPLHIGPFLLDKVPQPILDLSEDDDTGSSNSDNITNKISGITIMGTGEDGATVRLYDNEKEIPDASEIISGSKFSIDISLDSGSHEITAQQTDIEGNISPFSNLLSVIIDTTEPSVNIVNPADNSKIEKVLAIEGTASDTLTRISQVRLQITEGTKYLTPSGFDTEEPVWISANITDKSWSFDTDYVQWESAKYIITVQATDIAGNDFVTSTNFTIAKPSTITCKLSENNIVLGESIQISGQIIPPPKESGGAFVDIILTAQGGSEIHTSVNANIEGKFDYDIACKDITVAGVWKVQTSWQGDQWLQEAESEQQRLEVSKAKSRVTLDITSQAIKIGEKITINGKFTPEPDCGASLSYIPIKLKFISPNGDETPGSLSTKNQWGHFLLENYAGFDLLGEWTIQAVFEGNDAYEPSESDPVELCVVETAGYAIIVQGKLSNEEGIISHNKTTNFVYNQLKNRGLLDDDIRYFNYDTSQEGVYKAPSETGIQNAITEWALDKMNDKPANLYIVMVNHGFDDTFYISPDTITSTELANWLDTLQNSLVGQAKEQEIILLLGFCRSGSFIDELSGNNRVIIASAAPGESSYKGPLDEDNIREGEYFISEFFKAASFGKSLKKCFEEATLLTEIFTSSGSDSPNAPYYDNSLQHPLLDDDGDKSGTNDLSASYGDGVASENIFIGVSSLTGNNPGDVMITEVTETKFLSTESNSADLWATVNDNTRLRTLWVEVKPPNYKPTDTEGSGQAEMQLTKTVTVDYNSLEKRYEWNNLGGFSEPGIYQIFYFAKDDVTGNVSPLMESRVYKAKPDNQPPKEFSLISPENGKRISPTYFKDEDVYLMVLDWEDTADPDGDKFSYTVILSKTSECGNYFPQDDFDDTIRIEGVRTSRSLIRLPSNWVDNNQVCWKVRAIDEYGAVRESDEVRMFYAINDNESVFMEIYVLDCFTQDYVKNVTVTVAGKKILAENGKYDSLIELPPYIYEITLEKDGYMTKSKSAELIPGNIQSFYFRLIPESVSPLQKAVSVLQMISGLNTPAVTDCISDMNNDDKIGLEEAVYLLQNAVLLRE